MRSEKIPHRIILYGEPWTIKWHNPNKDYDEEGLEKGQVAQADFDTKTIWITAKVRNDLQQSWENLIHEIMHIVDEYESDWRKEHESKTRTDRSAKLPWKKLASRRHDEKGEGDTIYRLDLALGRIFADNFVSIACCCAKCIRKRLRKEQEQGVY